jgi:flagellar motility protein MotE (MotC chaperone)
MSGVPRLLPMIAVAIGGVLAMKAVSGLDAAPAFLKQAKAYAEEPAAGERKAGPTGPALAKPPAGPLPETALAAGDAGVPTAAANAVRATPACAAPSADLAKEAGLSPAELRVLQSLQSRRGELDQRAQALDTQTALLEAASAKLDAKLKSLADLKGQIQGLLGQADQRQDAEIQRLVKVYESMKPKDAAEVMSRLDDRVRLPVASKMKERALAAVLAQMPRDEAKKLTEKLATRFASDTLARQVAAADAAQAAPAAGTGKPASRAG